MNKLEIYNNGGEPHTLDDLKFVEKALRDGIINFGKGFKASGAMAIVFDGLTSANIGAFNVWSDGLAMRNGEMFYVTGGSVGLSAPDTYINFDETPDSNGTKVFENLATLDTYKIRAAYITGSPTGDTVNVDDMQTLSDVLARMVCDNGNFRYAIYPNNWNLVNSASTPAINSNWSPSIPLKYRLLKTKEVALQGTVINPSTANANHLIFTLPVGFRPQQTLFFTVYALAGGTVTSNTISVLTTGDVSTGPYSGTNLAVSLDSIRFFID